MTAAELLARFPHASAQFIRDNASDAKPAPAPARNDQRVGCLPAPELERDRRQKPLPCDVLPHKGETRFVVRITSRRVRLLDEDNLCEKFLVDGLRYAGIIPDDAPDRCRIITTQKKVAHFRDETTEIAIELWPMNAADKRTTAAAEGLALWRKFEAADVRSAPNS